MSPDLRQPALVLHERILGGETGNPDLDRDFIKPSWRRVGDPVQGMEPLVMPPMFKPATPPPGAAGTTLGVYNDSGAIEIWVLPKLRAQAFSF